MKIICLILSLILYPIIFKGQNTLCLTNGKQLKINEYRMEIPSILEYKNLKNKEKTIPVSKVFSIIDNSGMEQIIYAPNPTDLKALNVQQMRSFVRGRFDASQNFKAPWATVGGIIAAFPSPFTTIPVYATLGFTNPSQKKMNLPAELYLDESYVKGYTKEAKRKRMNNALKGSGITIAASLLVATLVIVIGGGYDM
jgi:hypothetical protein